MRDLDGPTMLVRIDVVLSDQPVKSAGDLGARATRQYESYLDLLAGHDRIDYPVEISNPDGTKTWQVAAGSGGRAMPADMVMDSGEYSADTLQSPDAKSWLSINEFAPSDMVVIA